MNCINKYLASVSLVLCVSAATAQTTWQTNWPTPEIEQMYNEARDLMSRGNLKQAIIRYQQAIQIAPDILVLHRELGKAYYISGDYENAYNTLDPIVKSGQADDQTYQALAASLHSSGETKKAKTILQKGIEQYPHSGLLYHEMGKMYEEGNELVYALETWLDGIKNDPVYHVNYYEAARTYMLTTKPIWAVIYGEMFINIEQQTPRANETRTMLIDAYKRIFNSLATGDIPKFGGKKSERASSFEEAVYATLIKLSPVMSDGITAENLIMLRTRFIMDWTSQYAEQYPFSLFKRHDEMIKNGYFDTYNQWLFGRAENQQVYDAWNKFHPEAMPNLLAWLSQNKYEPAQSDYYNKGNLDDIFIKKKN